MIRDLVSYLCICAWLFLLLLLSSCNSVDREATSTQEPWKVGAILTLTGGYAVLGQEMQRGIDIAVTEINLRGGIDGRNITVIYEDDGEADPKLALTAAQRLIEVVGVDVVVVTSAGDARPIMPLFEKAKIPLLILLDAYDTIRPAKYTFSIGFHVEQEGKLMAKFAHEKLGHTTAAIIQHQDEWAETVANAFAQEFEQDGGRITSWEKFSL